MPVYEVEHVCNLSEQQKDELAEAITRVHSTVFETPKLFVNVRVRDVSREAVYVAGKRRPNNRIFAYVRAGPSRTQGDYELIARQIEEAWDKIVPVPQVQRGQPKPDFELRLVMFYGAIAAGREAGFMIPMAGGDRAWLREHRAELVAKADAGDDEFAGLMEECRARGLVDP